MKALVGRERDLADALEAMRLKNAQLVLKYQALQDKVALLQQKLELAADRTALLTEVIQRVDAIAACRDPATAELDIQALFQLAEGFRTCGDLEMATACLHGCGPGLAEQLRRTASPDGRIVGPDFLIIGSPRAASSWLRRLLSMHPLLFLLAEEQHYFVDPERPLTSYAGKFASPEHLLQGKDPRTAEPGGRLFGEKSPRYAAMPSANIAYLAALYPNLRLICTVRDPVVRAWSEIRMSRLEADASDPDVLSGRRPCEAMETVIRHGRYLEHLRRWAEHFAPEQFLILDFDQIRDDPASAAAAAFEHIGAPPCELAREHLSLPAGAPAPSSPPAPLAAYLAAQYRSQPSDAATLRKALAEARPRGTSASSASAARRATVSIAE